MSFNFKAGLQCPVLAVLLLLLSIPNLGCQPTATDGDAEDAASNSTAKEPSEIKFLVIGDESLGAAITRQIKARSETNVILKSLSKFELGEVEKSIDGCDIVVYPTENFGELAASNLIAEIPKYAKKWESAAQQDVLRFDRIQLTQFGESQFGLSLGSTHLQLMYRKDVFDKLNLHVPTTWQEYQIVVDQLSKTDLENAGLSANAVPAMEPVADEWAAQMLLLRAASSIRRSGSFTTYFDIASMDSTIATSPFVNAAKSMKQAACFKDVDPAAAELALLRGETAMAFAWPSRAKLEGLKANETVGGIGVANVPGSIEVYDFRAENWRQHDEITQVPLVGTRGRMISVAKSSRRKSSAMRMLMLLCGKELGAKISTSSTETNFYRASPNSSRGRLDRTSLRIRVRQRLHSDDYGAEFKRNESCTITSPFSKTLYAIAFRGGASNSE